MAFEAALLILTALATAVAIAARWLKLPYTVALVLAGVILSSLHVLNPPHLTKDLLYAVFLPGLLFEAAFHLDARRFWQNKWGILALAVPGVVLGAALTAGMLAYLLPLLPGGWQLGLLAALTFGALISATDPIAVVALFKTLGAPKRLGILVEAESLLNDGTAVVLFTLILGIASGQAMTVPQAVGAFFSVAGGGIAVGLALGFCVSLATRTQEDPMIEITLTTLAAYGSFLLAEHFHLSGVMATVAAGMVCGSYGAPRGMSPSTRLAVVSFWSYVAFALNSLVFLLIGFEIHVSALIGAWLPILGAFAVVTVSRLIVVGGVSALVHGTAERLSPAWSAVMVWGGLRGGLSMVLALALPAGFPQRDLLITLTFGVVALSILLQGLTVAPLLARLGLVGTGTGRIAQEIGRAELQAARAGLQALAGWQKDGRLHPAVLAQLQAECEAAVEVAQAKLAELHEGSEALMAEEIASARRQLLLVRKDSLMHALHQGMIGQVAFDQLAGEVDEALLALES